MPWGEWLYTNKIIKYNDKYYLRVYLNESKSIFKVLTESNTYVNADEHMTSLLENYTISKNNNSKKQEDCGLEKEKQIKPFNLDISCIKAIYLNGVGDEVMDNNLFIHTYNSYLVSNK